MTDAENSTQVSEKTSVTHALLCRKNRHKKRQTCEVHYVLLEKRHLSLSPAFGIATQQFVRRRYRVRDGEIYTQFQLSFQTH
jgi:hypothetical protein